MEHRNGKFNVAKVPRALGHVLATCCALVCAVDAAQLRVVQTPLTWPLALFVHCLGILDVANTHIFGFFGREETELNLLNRLERRLRVGETWCCRHGCDRIWIPARLALEIIQAVIFLSSTRAGDGHACALLFSTLAVCYAACDANPLLPTSTPIAQRNLREARLLCSCSQSSVLHFVVTVDVMPMVALMDLMRVARSGRDMDVCRKMRARRRSRRPASGMLTVAKIDSVRREAIPTISRRSRRY